MDVMIYIALALLLFGLFVAMLAVRFVDRTIERLDGKDREDRDNRDD